MFKNNICLLIGILIFLVACSEEPADKTVDLIVNSRQIPIGPQPFIRDGQVFVPLGVVAEELGAQVVWNDKNNSIFINQGQGQGDLYLKGQYIPSGSGIGIQNNLIKAVDLKNILDDDKDNDLVDYRVGHNGGDILANDPLVVDLRNKEDYNARHIPGAIWIAAAKNMAEAQNVQNLKSLLKKHVDDGGKNEIVVYCSTGNTSGIVSGVLGAQNLPVRNLMYGFDIAWRGTGIVDNTIYAPMEDSSGQKHLCGG